MKPIEISWPILDNRPGIPSAQREPPHYIVIRFSPGCVAEAWAAIEAMARRRAVSWTAAARMAIECEEVEKIVLERALDEVAKKLVDKFNREG